MASKQNIRIHISLIEGQWYAMPANNSHATRCALVAAINYCKRMNAQREMRPARRPSEAVRRTWRVLK